MAHNRLAVALEVAISAATSRLAVTADRRSERAREAITGLVSRGLLGGIDGWVWLK
jgi:putative DNA primase/helicase